MDLTPDEVEAIIKGREEWIKRMRARCSVCHRRIKYNSPNSIQHKACMLVTKNENN